MNTPKDVQDAVAAWNKSPWSSAQTRITKETVGILPFMRAEVVLVDVVLEPVMDRTPVEKDGKVIGYQSKVIGRMASLHFEAVRTEDDDARHAKTPNSIFGPRPDAHMTCTVHDENTINRAIASVGRTFYLDFTLTAG